MPLRPILMLIMVSFLMDIHPEKSPEKKTPTISVTTADRQFWTTAENEAAIFPLIPIASGNAESAFQDSCLHMSVPANLYQVLVFKGK